MNLFLKVVLFFAALVTISGTPHNRNGPHGRPLVLDGPGPHGHLIAHEVNALEDDSKDKDMVTMGDMIINKRMMRPRKHGNRMKRQPLNDEQLKWPKANGVVTVPYTTGSASAPIWVDLLFVPNSRLFRFVLATGVDSKLLQRAIEIFNSKTCVRFVQRGSQANYVKFRIVNRGCVTPVGNQRSGEQNCNLTSTCAAKKGKLLHEMMHILGFLHEQCRPDRDSYITVHTDRIKIPARGNFDKIQESIDQGIPYDCDSILHYRAAAFAATSGQNTITSTYCSHLGNDDTRLSLLDYKRVNTLYSCGKPQYKYYKVVVVTDSTPLSGTDCFIYLTLHGSQQTSTEFELDLSTNPSANLFEAGSTDTFNYMAYRNDLGSITGISVRMVSHGSAAGWWPTTFTVTDPATSTSVTFTNNKWLYPSSTYGTSNFPRQ